MINTTPSELQATADLILIETPTSGRALIATRTIPADTPILIAPAPFAHVIYRTFRKEVCAACFKYARDAGKMVWSIRWMSGAVDNGGGGKSKVQGGGTAYFCTDTCKDSWNLGVGPLLAEVNIALEKASQQIKKSKSRSSANKTLSVSEAEPKKDLLSDPLCTSVLQDLVDLIADTRSPENNITQEKLNTAWNLADIFVNSTCFTSRFDCAVIQLDLDLDEMELEVARLVASAIVQRYFEDRIDVKGSLLPLPSSKNLPCDTEIPPIPSSPTINFPSWSSLLSLQPNELSNVCERPYDLGVHLRVYVFLVHVLRSRHVPSFMGGTSRWKAEMKTSGLAAYVQTSEMVRAVLARDPGNAFGIWELGQSADNYLNDNEARGEQKKDEGSNMDSKEMLGWGIWPEASYFNHSCNPNVVKKRVARNLVFITTNIVQKGEELCIAYVDCGELQISQVDELAAREKRRELLRKWWFFGCACTRCSFVEKRQGEE